MPGSRRQGLDECTAARDQVKLGERVLPPNGPVSLKSFRAELVHLLARRVVDDQLVLIRRRRDRGSRC